MEQLAVGSSSDLVNWRRVQVDEDGTGHVFAAAGLGEEGLVGATLAELLRIGVGTAIGQQAVLEEVPGGIVSVLTVGFGAHAVRDNVQLPGAVAQLCASLADVKVADL